MNAFIKFNKGVMKLPLPWRLWNLLLASVNMVVPLFFLDHVEARYVLAAMLAGVMLMTLLTGLSGFSRLLGLGHLPWIPLLYVLWARLGYIPAVDPFGIWLRVLIILNLISLVIDAIDVVRYIGGDRAETVHV